MGADHYETLGVPRDADAATIKAAHRRAVNRTHPDKEGGDREKFDEVQTAWLVLKDPVTRAKYDRGEDPSIGPDNRASQVTQMAIKAFMEAAASGDSQFDDFVSAAVDTLEKDADKADTALQTLAQERKRWTEVSGRISRAGSAGPDFLSQSIAAQLRNIDESEARIKERLSMTRDAIEMLDGFEYRTDAVEPAVDAAWRSSPFTMDEMSAAIRRQHQSAFFDLLRHGSGTTHGGRHVPFGDFFDPKKP